MSFGHLLLEKRVGEDVSAFDARINKMLPVVAGRVFFDVQNFWEHNGDFNLYAAWDKELNAKLNDKLPAQGFKINANAGLASALAQVTDGVPVYIDLIARNGRIYPNEKYIMWYGHRYTVEYNGSSLKAGTTPETDAPTVNVVAPSGSQESGSQRGFVISGSQRGLVELSGSQREFAISGSQREFSIGGSQRSFSLGGSQRGTHEWEWEYGIGGSQRGVGLAGLTGSQREFTVGGSQRGFVELGGSQREFTISGSQREFAISGSQRDFTLPAGSQKAAVADTPVTSQDAKVPEKKPASQVTWNYMPEEWQLINKAKRPAFSMGGNSRFGYGLDLI